MSFIAKNNRVNYFLNKIVVRLLWCFGGNVIKVSKKNNGNNIEYIVFSAGKIKDTTAPELG